MRAGGTPVAGSDVRRPVLARTRAELTDALEACRARGGRVGLVATMGALHAGHVSLVRKAHEVRAVEDAVVVSIFVNPLQFGPEEDLASYPRSLDADLEVCAAERVDVVFAPGSAEMYPEGEPLVTVEPGPLGEILEGRVRPTHFRGVLTVVAKLFGSVRPDFAVFGEKDYQQLVLIRQIAVDLAMQVEVMAGETVREIGGLALSSRNEYLDDDQRALARALWQALRVGADAADRGAEDVLAAARGVLAEATALELDYLELTSPALGAPPASGAARLLVAARVGPVRLIDNTGIVLGRPADQPD